MRSLIWTLSILLLHLIRDISGTNRSRPKRSGCFGTLKRLFSCLNPESDEDDQEAEANFNGPNEASALLRSGRQYKFPELVKSKEDTPRKLSVGLGSHRANKKEQYVDLESEEGIDDNQVETAEIESRDPEEMAEMDPFVGLDNAFYVACANGQIDIVRLLLKDRQLDPSANNNEAIHVALKYCHDEVVKVILRDRRFETDLFLESIFELVVKIKMKTLSQEEILAFTPEVFDCLRLRLIHEHYIEDTEAIKRYVVWRSLELRTPKAQELLYDPNLRRLSAADLSQFIDSIQFRCKL